MRSDDDSEDGGIQERDGLELENDWDATVQWGGDALAKLWSDRDVELAARADHHWGHHWWGS